MNCKSISFSNHFNSNCSLKNWISRYIIFTIGLYFLALGVVLIVKSSLGTSPISSFAYVVSLNTPITLGTGTFLVNTTLVILQLWLVRDSIGSKKDRLEILMQMPFSLIFGAMIDLNMWLTKEIIPHSYPIAIAILACGCIIQAFGIAIELKPNVVAMSAEGFVKYAARRYNKDFGKLKVLFDTTLVIIAVIASLWFTSTIEGVREGTIIAAITIGWLVSQLNLRIFNRHRQSLKRA